MKIDIKRMWTVLFLCVSLSLKSKEEYISQYSQNNLDLLKQKSTFLYERTLQQLNILRSHFEQNEHILSESTCVNSMPSIIHFIWLGPKKVPDERILRSWQEKNPSFETILWTDRVRILDLQGVQQNKIQHLSPLRLQKEYNEAQNWGEKSDILRLEILERFGGVYADIDMECLQPFDILVQNCTFFVGLGDLWPTFLDNYFQMPNNLIGASKNHPIICKTMDLIHQNWDGVTSKVKCLGLSDYHPEKTYEFQLTFARTYIPLSQAILKIGLNQGLGPRDLIFPSRYFHGSPSLKKPLYVRNYSFNSWMTEEQKMIQNTEAISHYIEKKLKKCLMRSKQITQSTWCWCIFICGVVFVCKFKRIKSNKRSPC